MLTSLLQAVKGKHFDFVGSFIPDNLAAKSLNYSALIKARYICYLVPTSMGLMAF